MRAFELKLVAAALVALAVVRPAQAAGADAEAQSKALFADARQLAKDGKYADACPKFEQALRLHAGIGIEYNLADCWEHVGRTASARALFTGVVARAHAAGQSEREELARQRAAALEPRLSHLLIEVKARDEKLTVRQNQLPLEPAALGVDRVVDPGKYTIEASAPGKQSFSREVEVADKPVTVTVPELEPAGDAKKTDAACDGKAEKPEAATAESQPRARQKPRRAQEPAVVSHRPEYVLPLLGVGASGIVAGTILGLKYRSANEFASNVCPAQVGCTEFEVEDHAHAVDDAKMFRTWSLVSFGVGGAAFAGAAILYLNPKVTRASRAWTAEPYLTADGSWGLSAHGRF